MTRTQPISRRQEQVLEFIKAELAAGRPFPSRVAIAEHIGWKTTSGSNDCLHGLAYKGYLIRVYGPGRIWHFSLPEVEHA